MKVSILYSTVAKAKVVQLSELRRGDIFVTRQSYRKRRWQAMALYSVVKTPGVPGHQKVVSIKFGRTVQYPDSLPVVRYQYCGGVAVEA